jgi:hypothetical protein
MRKLVKTLLAGAVLAVTASSAPARGPAPAPSARPNVVVILVDDLGWPDVSAYGRHDVETPNIDRIAHSGVAFSSGYVTASVCAVSRAGLLSGRMPMRFGYTYNINDDGNGGDDGAGLPESQKTIAERLKPWAIAPPPSANGMSGRRTASIPPTGASTSFSAFWRARRSMSIPRPPAWSPRPRLRMRKSRPSIIA